MRDVEGGSLEPCTIAYARRPIRKGEELYNSYGDHPSFVFATHFGFVPGILNAADASAAGALGAASTAAANDEERECWACELQLGGEGADARIGPSIVLAAQMRAAQMMEAGEYSYDYLGEEEEEETEDYGDDDFIVDAEEEQGGDEEEQDVQLALASLLIEAFSWASYPLKFIVTRELIASASSEAAKGQSVPSREDSIGAVALLTCARLCALDFADLARISARTDGTCGDGGVDDGGDPNAQLERALQLLLCTPGGRLSSENDAAAAQLIEDAAREQLRAVQEAETAAATAEKSPDAGQAVLPPRAACVALARQTRAAEAFVLRELIDGGAKAMFDL